MGTFNGVIIEGSKRARALGYPTVNIAYAGEMGGIYAALVRIDKTLYRAAAFADPARKVLEAYVFGLNDEVYGRSVTIELKQKIRDAGDYDSDELLKVAIEKDIIDVRNYFDK